MLGISRRGRRPGIPNHRGRKHPLVRRGPVPSAISVENIYREGTSYHYHWYLDVGGVQESLTVETVEIFLGILLARPRALSHPHQSPSNANHILNILKACRISRPWIQKAALSRSITTTRTLLFRLQYRCFRAQRATTKNGKSAVGSLLCGALQKSIRSAELRRSETD